MSPFLRKGIKKTLYILLSQYIYVTPFLNIYQRKKLLDFFLNLFKNKNKYKKRSFCDFYI